MSSIADVSVKIQTSSHAVPSTPSWFGEAVLIVGYLKKLGVLNAIAERVRFARRRFGHFEVIDFVAVLFGYAISGERTLEVFYERLQPFAAAYMALFGRDRLPARSTLSRFLGALTPEPVEALRALFLSDGLARPLGTEKQTGGLWDRTGTHWLVFDVDGTREAARQRALPQTEDRPPAQRRLRPLCAPGYTGRKRGEVVRTRTVVSQAHSSQWLGSFGNPGNGHYREELRHAVAAIHRYLSAHQFPQECALLRLDGQYGAGAVLADLAGLCYVMRGKDYQLLDRAEVQARLHLPADGSFTRPESELVRTLYDCPDVPVGSTGQRCRVIVATHPSGKTKSRVGVERGGIVYELFLTKLPQQAFTASDVVALYLHRGAFEPTLADLRPGARPRPLVFSYLLWAGMLADHLTMGPRTCAWNWAISLSLLPCAPPSLLQLSQRRLSARLPPLATLLPRLACPGKPGASQGATRASQADGTLRCPAGKSLYPTEQRREADGTLRVLYAARIGDCRSCRLRKQCQWHGRHTKKPRRVSMVLHPLQGGSAPLWWRDWSRREHRRACMLLLRHQRVEIQFSPPSQDKPDPRPSILSRAQRAHYRLSWHERLARNARDSTACRPTITLFGVPDAFAAFLGLPTQQ